MSATAATIGTPAPARAKNLREIFLVTRQLRQEAAAEMRAAFPGALKRYALPMLPESTISKARLGYTCGAFFRAALVLYALKMGGADRERAQRLADWIQSLVDRWWPKDEIPSLEEAQQREQEIDRAEDCAQVATCLRIPGAARKQLDAIRERRAHDAVMEAVLLRQIEIEEAGR